MKFQEFEAINAKLKNGGIILLLVQLIKIQITVKCVMRASVCTMLQILNDKRKPLSILLSFARSLIENDVTGNLRGIVAVIVSRFIYCTFKIESVALSTLCAHMAAMYNCESAIFRFYCFSSYLFLIARMLLTTIV